MPRPAVVATVAVLRSAVARARAAGLRIGLVPTMGALHPGHLSLVAIAKQRADFVVVSIFVNPPQFGPGEDLGAYPRTLGADLQACAAEGVDLVWTPEVADMYPAAAQTWVEVTELANGLCAEQRPGHFRGVTTVVTKLFVAVQADVAVFGEKDYQQLVVLRRMARDLLLPVDVVGGPIVREADGLAMSSRNRYLSDSERRQATALSRALKEMQRLRAGGETRAADLAAAGRKVLTDAGIERIDYLQIVDAERLEPVQRLGGPPARAMVAARVGPARLIDNMAL